MDLHCAMQGQTKVGFPLYKSLSPLFFFRPTPLSLRYSRISPKFVGERKAAIVFS